MSIESITEKIVSEANAFAADAITHAETEAKSIAEEYESIANKEFDQIVDAAYEKSREIMNRANAARERCRCIIKNDANTLVIVHNHLKLPFVFHDVSSI